MNPKERAGESAVGYIKDGMVVGLGHGSTAKYFIDSLGAALRDATAFNIYRNPLGQLILDPVKAIPVSEMWLYETPQALASVKQGLREAAEGKSVDRGSFAKHAKA